MDVVERVISPKQKIVRKRVSSLKPSPENATLYPPKSDDFDRIDRLARTIAKNGCDPITITRDKYIVSGHRRHAALKLNGQEFVRCIVLEKRRRDYTRDEYLTLLREYNEQRDKSIPERINEEIVVGNDCDLERKLDVAQTMSLLSPEVNGITPIIIEGEKKRHGISGTKTEHVEYIKKIVFEERREFWPLSVRSVHYPLLNYKFIRGYYWPRKGEPGYGKKETLWYANDSDSYKATARLITTLRLNGTLPWEAFDDPTRPFTSFPAFRDVRYFVRQEQDNMFKGYWRDYLQSQPNHIEVVCEKNTVYPMILRVTERYQIPTMSGRGFSSIDPWHDMHERYLASGKKRLVVIVVSDFDPEGEMIPQACARTMRDDFGVSAIKVIKAGVTREQIVKYNLPKQNFAKEKSKLRPWFAKRNNGDDSVYELEALEPQAMIDDLDGVIRGVLDIDLFNREVEIEQEEKTYLEESRRRLREAIRLTE